MPAGSTPAANKTIDRLYTGFVRLDKIHVSNSTMLVGDGPSSARSSLTIITAQRLVLNGDVNWVKLTASNVVITEDGGSSRTIGNLHHQQPLSDSGSGTVAQPRDHTDTIASLAPGASECSRSSVRLTNQRLFVTLNEGRAVLTAKCSETAAPLQVHKKAIRKSQQDFSPKSDLISNVSST